MNKKVIIGQIGLSFHKASAGVFFHVLHRLGYEVELVTEMHEKMFYMQREGKIDLLISAWLPGSHGKYLEPYRDHITPLDVIYQPYCIWGVPDYISPKWVNSIADLSKPEVISKMDNAINGIGMGAGISRFSAEMIVAYGLRDHGYHFVSNEEDVFSAIVERKMKAKKWFIIPLWHPHYLLATYNIRALDEPKGLLRGKDNATPLLLNASQDKIDRHHLSLLSRITLGNAAVTDMDFIINKKQKTPLEASQKWIEQEFDSIDLLIKKLSSP